MSESASLLKRGIYEGLHVRSFSIEKGMDELDSHEFPLDNANALIRYFLERKRSVVAASPASKGTSDSRLVIVTGRDNRVNSDGRQGVLREEVKVLRQELEVEVTVSPDNLGRVVVIVSVVNVHETNTRLFN